MVSGSSQPVSSPAFYVRLVVPADNVQVAEVIRSVLTEHGCTAQGFAIHDPEVDVMYETYQLPRSIYYVAECEGRVVGGCGIAPLRGADSHIAELQKFYILPDYRGLGIGQQLLVKSIEFAKQQLFQQCYIETIERMSAADKLYRKHGFEPIEMSLGNTGHSACDRWYVKRLAE